MDQKNIVVIGGNTGIGKSLVEILERKGARVYAYSRTSQDRILDVRDTFDSIPDLPETIDGLAGGGGNSDSSTQTDDRSAT